MRSSLHVQGADLVAPGGRVLARGLTLALSDEKVALIGRNGVGKTLLLEALASGELPRLRREGRVHYVPQLVPSDEAARRGALLVRRLERVAPSRAALVEGARRIGLPSPDAMATGERLSPGQVRKVWLLEAMWADPDVLLLDEPTADLDEDGRAFVRDWLRGFSGTALVATHDRELLADFCAFVWMRERGVRGFEGTLDELDGEAAREERQADARYAGELARLAATESRTLHIARRRARKKQTGRCRELDRGTPKVRLNMKRGAAQVSHGRDAARRAARLEAARALGLGARRALAVDLPLVVDAGAKGAGEHATTTRPRVAVVGPNGSGKTTWIKSLLEGDSPLRASLGRIGYVDQGATLFATEESLMERLAIVGADRSLADAAAHVAAHKFPLALAMRPLATLSPGERVRASLVALFYERPRVDSLVLDEPMFGVDPFGQRAMADALRAWPGGLVVATHERGASSAWGSDLRAPPHVVVVGPRRVSAHGAPLADVGLDPWDSLCGTRSG